MLSPYFAGALAEDERAASIYSDDLPGPLSALVACSGGRTVRLRPEVVAGWGLGAEEAFVLALANLRRRHSRRRWWRCARAARREGGQAVKRILAVAGALMAAGVACTGAFWRRRPRLAPWTGPFSPSQYAAFVEVVLAELGALGDEGRIQDGCVSVASGEWRGRYGLENVAQLCAQHERREWPAIVRAHLAALARAQREHEAGAVRTFAEAASLLAVRLWPVEYLAQVPCEQVLCHEDLPGTVTVLVYDLPETVQQVRPQEITGWGKSVEELFALGLDNLRRKPRPQIRRSDLPGGVRVTVFSGNSFFVASEALRLSQFPGCIGRHGALLGVPTRHALVAYPIDGAEVVKAMMLMAPIVAGIYSQGPGGISPRLYWLHEGRYVDLPYIVKDRRPEFAPPEEFIALVKRLAAEEG